MTKSTQYDDQGHSTRIPQSPRAIADPRAAVVAVATVLGALAFTAFLVWHAPYERDEAVPYDKMLEIRDGWWATHYFGGTAMGFGFVALALATCLLVQRGTGSVLVTIGSGLTLLGGIAVAPGLAGEGVAYSYATDQNAVAAEPGARLLEYMFDHPDRYLVLLLAGLIAATIGCLLISVGLWRARTVPRWIPVALAFGTILMNAVPHSIAWWATLPRTVAAVAIGVYVWLASRRRGSGPA